MDDGLLFVVALLAVLCEGMIEYFIGTAFDKFAKLTPYRWMIMYISAAGGVVLALAFKADLIAYLLGSPDQIAGMVITGLIIGRGSNYLHDLVALIASLKLPSNKVVNVSFPAEMPIKFDPATGKKPE